MGGEIWVESKLGKGSTFNIKLPLRLASEAALPSPEPEMDSEIAAPEALRVLAVDDNGVNLMVLDQLLSSLGHQVVKAASGPEALSLLSAEVYDLVLLDIQMPEMTGTEVLQRLRATEGPNRDAPVVALTADVTTGGREHYLGLGFTEHAAKPIQIQALMEAMGRAMAAAPMIRPLAATAGREATVRARGPSGR